MVQHSKHYYSNVPGGFLSLAEHWCSYIMAWTQWKTHAQRFWQRKCYWWACTVHSAQIHIKCSMDMTILCYLLPQFLYKSIFACERARESWRMRTFALVMTSTIYLSGFIQIKWIASFIVKMGIEFEMEYIKMAFRDEVARGRECGRDWQWWATNTVVEWPLCVGRSSPSPEQLDQPTEQKNNNKYFIMRSDSDALLLFDMPFQRVNANDELWILDVELRGNIIMWKGNDEKRARK